MKTDPDVSLSKMLSYVLRHEPASIGLDLDSAGWVQVDLLLLQLAKQGRKVSREDLERVVANSDKKRFTLSADLTRIRAAQGHSVEVDLALPPIPPPPVLYHGTTERLFPAILKEGLKPQSRQQVHLSADTETATKVGQRHGKPVVLRIAAQEMTQNGFSFYRADNGVWLTDCVPPEFIQASPLR